MLTGAPITHKNSLRDTITKAYRMDEATCLSPLIQLAALPEPSLENITDTAAELVTETRAYIKKQGQLDTLLHQYDLSTDEGIALMCLAEALLRIPDKTTMDKFISDKLTSANWKSNISNENSLFVNAATWSLLISGKVFSPMQDQEATLSTALKRAGSRIGIGMIRPIILRMMKSVGEQFVMGQDIEAALKRAKSVEEMGYRFSYDMLGEAARTEEDAKRYFDSYMNAIRAMGKKVLDADTAKNPGISIKLSALHPRFEYTQREVALAEITPLLLTLATEAKKYNIGVTMDAEEADRLDLSLDIFERVFCDTALDDWEGLGLAVQAYQKRASFVIDWLADISKRQGKRIMVRLVKGAYWDSEIKMSQVQGLSGYPVFTRKNSTDVSYIACATKLLRQPECFYAQFGTHNAHTVATIIEIAGESPHFEFQCLHGMGRPLYDQIVDPDRFALPCRIYAPVGTHKDLLGYLVRRLLENGANSSFVNRLADDSVPIEKIINDPVKRIASLMHKPHPHIPLPKDIYGDRLNSTGYDLSDSTQLNILKRLMDNATRQPWIAAPLVNGRTLTNHHAMPVTSPADSNLVIGTVSKADEAIIDEAINSAEQACRPWGETSVEERAAILERAADLFQQDMPALIAMICREGGRTVLDAMSEVREATDFCRYYAERARKDLAEIRLPGPTGESNILSLHPRGIFACISPWNFPLAIFTGQVVAALAAGNTVIAKPAEQTPLIAYRAVQLLHEAGIPKDVLHLVIGRGSVVGPKLTNDPRIAGVMFTGSTETAKSIELSLAKRSGPIATFIAETGGQNAMIVDSSALAEQSVIDIVQSSFNSAGQRCSALRVLFVQEDIAPLLLNMLKGYMQSLTIGDPSMLCTDIGPVIDAGAQEMLQAHYAKMSEAGKLLATVPLSSAKNGYYFAPCAFEISDLSVLEGEVFGPILHVIRYPANGLDKVMDAIINTGYGLTLGIHSRIDSTTQYVADRMPVGNIYINRNMIGAVVGVQPFGGERLSGTGPKAGGPHYLPRLCVERTVSINTTAIGGNARLVSMIEDD